MWSRGIGRRVLRVVALGAGVLPVALVSGQAFAGSASLPSALPPAASSTTTTTLPAIPKVDKKITDGLDPQTLLTNAIELSSVGIDTSALSTAIAATQAKMDQDASEAQAAEQEAAVANGRAADALRRADVATSAYDSLDGAMKDAVVFLYTNGSDSLTISPTAGTAAIYAADYAESALSPYGVLADRAQQSQDRKAALKEAKSAQKRADRAAKKAAAALAAEQGEAQRLQRELSAISGASASEVAADHVAIAGQAGKELLSASALQFNPKTPLPPPVSTTPIALTWAFAELGKPYVWGATGPKTFDCSGLTQFVWHAAGINTPRVAADQDSWSIPVPLSQLLPGDLVFYGKTDIHHVGIYIGDGLMINAPHTGDVVRVSSIWWSDLAGFGRVHTKGTPVPPHQAPTPTKPAKPVVVPTAGNVPSQTKPPAGWKPKPGSTTPIRLSGGGSAPAPAPATTTTSTTTSTTLPATPSTTVPVLPTTTVATIPGQVVSGPETTTSVPTGT